MVETHSNKLSPFGPALQFDGGSKLCGYNAGVNDEGVNAMMVKATLFRQALSGSC
jgi:hypothetical protein